MLAKLILPIFLVIFAQISAAQTVPEKKSATEDPEKFKKEAIAFLRETMADISNLRTLENRISFAAEMAGLIWFHDEKEARGMFTTAIADFRELLLQYDARMNEMPSPEDGDFSGGMFGEASDRMRLEKRFQMAMQVRQQIAASIAEHDADLAFSFYHDSLAAISNPEFRKQMEDRDTYFEHQLILRVAESNAGKAAQYGVRSLEKGVNFQHIEMLKKIHAKDAEKGIEFGSAVLNRLKNEKFDSSEFYVMNSLLEFGGSSLEESKKNGKKAVFSQQQLRELADVFAQALLNIEGDEGATALQYVDRIERFSSSRASQIRARFRAGSNGTVNYSNANRAVADALHAAAIAANTASNANSVNYRELEEREQNEQKLMDDVQKLDAGQLPKEDRERVTAQARKILLLQPGREKKILGLSMLATQVARAGDKELAADIMKDAQNLVNPNPKNYQDYVYTWMLATGYADADPDKAFPLLEDTIMRLNDTIAAFIKVGEFIDTAGEMIQDGEVQVGAFGGSMVRGMTSELGMADATLRTLARADFTKTKNLTNRFDRSEVRILAKMMILRAVLGEKKESKTNEVSLNRREPPQPKGHPPL